MKTCSWSNTPGPGATGNVFARSDQPAPQVYMVNIQLPDWLTSPAPQMMYIWAPGW